MRVFVTGATGFIGSAIVQELLGAGHQVLGLARSEASAASLAAAGAEVHLGDLNDLESLRSGAAASDGVIHAGFIHDFSNFVASCATDKLAIETIGATLAGSNRPFVVTSGIGLLAPGRLATEDHAADPHSAASPRVGSETAALALASQGVRVSLLRLPPSVHGDGDHGFVPMVIGMARQKGVSAYVGEGLNCWPAVHRQDAARLYRLVLEKGTAGARYHGVGEEGIPFRDIARVIGRQLNMPVVGKSGDEAAGHFGWFLHFASINVPASSAQTQQQMGWKPTQIGLIADLETGTYFQG
jgi:nucleoside-diphosphate-sugar epimerase